MTVSKTMGAALAYVLLLGAGTAFAMGSGFGGESGESSAESYKKAVDAVEERKFDSAIDHLRKVLDDDSRNANALNYMGYSYRKLGKYDRALEYYQRALKVDPDHKGANEYIGEAYLEMNRPDQAKVHLDRLAEICNASCEEYTELKKAWDAWQARQKQG